MVYVNNTKKIKERRKWVRHLHLGIFLDQENEREREKSQTEASRSGYVLATLAEAWSTQSVIFFSC